MDGGSFLISICLVSGLSLNVVYVFPTFNVLHFIIVWDYYILAITSYSVVLTDFMLQIKRT